MFQYFRGEVFSPALVKQVCLSHVYQLTFKMYFREKELTVRPTDAKKQHAKNLTFKKYLITLYFQVLHNSMKK